MNRSTFQIYGTKKTGVFQSTWDTTAVSSLGGESAAITASGTNWILNTGATNLNVGGYKHTVGSTASLTTTLSAIVMQMYQITYTISARTTGSVSINYGAVTTSGITASSVVSVLATATTAFSITPTSDFDGVVSISVKLTSSATNQIKLPLPNVGTYNIYVDWGDGTYNNITSYNSINTLHTYPSSGIYTVRITGDIFNWSFGPPSTNDRTKIKTISSWGKLRFNTYCFFGCSNLTLSEITDVPTLTSVTSFQYLFGGCSKITTIGRSNEWNTSSVTYMGNMFDSCTLFNSNVSNWNLSNVTSTAAMFYNCTNFNQNIGSFNLTNCTDINTMLAYCTNFNNGGSSDINNWRFKTTGNVDAYGVLRNMPNFNQPVNNWNTERFTRISTMFFSSTLFNQNLNNWNLSNCNSATEVFQYATSFNNGFISGDGVGNQLTWNLPICTTVSNMFNGATSFNSTLGTGSTPWIINNCTNFYAMFQGATQFNNGENVAPINNWSINTISAVDMSNMFNSAYIFNRDIQAWNMTKVTSINSMFSKAYLFDKPLAGWERSTIGNVSTLNSVTNMNSTFLDARVFNQPIGNWDTSSVTIMNGMFSRTGGAGTNLFNQCIGTWNVSKVTSFTGMFYANAGPISFNNGDNSVPMDNWVLNTSPTASVVMSYMFLSSPFNRYLGSWNTSRVTLMDQMFQGTPFNNGFASGVANQLTWNTSGCTNMSNMFSYASGFNSNLGTSSTPWDVSKVTSFTSMFIGTSNFNNGDNTAPINNWNIGGNVTGTITMNQMFQSSIFNKYIGDWDVSKVTAMGNMFLSNTSFNQDISKWNMSSVTSMDAMFYNTNAFTNGSNTNTNPITGLTGINGWNINTTAASVTMTSMFGQNTVFNQPIDSWNVSKVTNMSGMFYNASAFNKPLGSWNVSSVTNFTNFMFGKTNLSFSSANLDAIYNGWSAQTLQHTTPITISFGTAKYSQAGKTGKDTLLSSPNNWIITDGLLSVSTTSNNGGLIRVTTTATHGFTASTAVYIYGVGGTTNANGTFTASVINTTQIELQGSTYNATYTSGGNVILG